MFIDVCTGFILDISKQKNMISVIVPSFNAEKYIERCLKSICNQTYRDLEILVIDDGSTDDTAIIVKKFVQTDDRVKYYYQNNTGVSAARNHGIDLALGELITFVDADDSIVSEMYHILVEQMEINDADITQCSYMRNINGQIKYIGGSDEQYIFTGEDITLSLLEAKMIVPSVCNKLFKRRVIDGIRFDEKYRINEDYLFDFFTFQNAKKSVFLDSCYYIYYSTSSSSCKNTQSVKKAEDCFSVSEIILEKSIGKTYEQIAEKRYYLNHLRLFQAYLYSKKLEDRIKAKAVRKQIIILYKKNVYSGNDKKNAFLISYFPFFYRPIYSIYNRIRKPNWDL